MAFIIQYRQLRKHVQRQLQEAADTQDTASASTRIDTYHAATDSNEKFAPEPNKIRDLSFKHIPGISIDVDCYGEQYYRVGWEAPTDPFNPQQWSNARRICSTLLVCLVGLLTTMTSSIDAAILTKASQDFGVSEVVESLATALYLVGFGVGALVASPLSEMVGRYPVYLGTLVVFAGWLVGAALAPNIGAQLVFRFLAGLMGSAPLTVSGGSISDIWNMLEITFGLPMFAIPGFGGPVLGPVVGAYIGSSPHISWRWSEWVMLIFDGLVITIIFLCQRETFSSQILFYKARFFRRATGDARFKTELEASGSASIASTLKRNFSRPWILVKEPIVLAFTMYMVIVYIVLFTFLDGYPYIFGEVHGINEGLSNICFVGLFVGILLAMVLVPILYNRTVKQLANDKDDGSGYMLKPESRLFFSMVGAPFLPIGLFWMGWTDYSWISIWSPLAASVVVGFGIICIFLSAYMYIIQSYQQYAASALTFVALVRYLAAGGMTVVGIPMYKNLGVHWTLTVLGIISTVATLIPYVLFRMGSNLRTRSKYAVAFKT